MTTHDARPPHLQPRWVLLVLAGGLLGTAARYAVSLALPTRAGHWPTSTFLINLTGACALGFLLEALERCGPDTRWRRGARLAAGTGFMGAFTTYSTLAVDADLLIRDHHPALASGYALATLVLGLLATLLGVAVAGRTTGTLPLNPDIA